MKTLLKKIGILISMIIMFCGSANAQYEVAVRNDDGLWITDNYIDFPLPYGPNISRFNYKDVTIAGIGGDTVYIKLVDTSASHNAIPVQYWVFTNLDESLNDTIRQSGTDSVYYILPENEIRFEYINAYTDTTIHYEESTEIIMWSKFLQPSFLMDTLNNNSKSINDSVVVDSVANLTFADFGLTIDVAHGTAHSAYYSLINWYRNDTLVFQGTGLDTIYSANVTGYYRIQVEVAYVTKSFIIGDTTTRTFKFWNSSSDTIHVIINNPITSVGEYNNYGYYEIEAYPNPTTDYLYISKKVSYTVLSITGQKIVEGFGDKIDVNNFKSGVYLLKTINGCNRFIVK